MVIGRLTVPAGARRWYAINFPWMQDGEIPISFVCTVTAEQGAADEVSPTYTITDTQIDTANRKARFLGGGGIDGTSYTVHAHAKSSLEQESDDCIVFDIDNGGC